MKCSLFSMSKIACTMVIVLFKAVVVRLPNMHIYRALMWLGEEVETDTKICVVPCDRLLPVVRLDAFA